MSETEVPINNTSKVIAIGQDYLILGKSTKETEVRINFVPGATYEEDKKLVESRIRLAAYAEGLVAGTIAIPAYIPEKPIKMHVEEPKS